MAHLYDNESGLYLGEIADAHLRFLVDQLEEEGSADRDYYLDVDGIDLLEDSGAPEELLSVLRRGLGEREGFEVRWADVRG